MKTKAAILVGLNKPLIIDDVEIPRLDIGQVLVKVLRSGICGSQLGEIHGIKGPDRFLPHLLGHEGSAIVLETGPGVTAVKREDLVVLHWRKGAGIQSQPPTYSWKGANLNAGWVTTFNEHAVVSENRLTVIPPDSNRDTAVLYGCALTTAFGVMERDAVLMVGQSLVIFGAGGVGLCEILAANLRGAYPIVAIDVAESKLALSMQLGATHVLLGTSQDLPEKIHEIVGAGGADVVIDNTGQQRQLAYQLTHGQGRTVLVGVSPHGEKMEIDSLPLHFGKVLTGSHGGRCYPTEDIPRYMKLERGGRISLDKLISHKFKLDEINLALDTHRSGNAIRCLIDMAEE